MEFITYQNGELRCEDVAIAALAEQYGTPLFVYSRAALLTQLSRVQSAFAELSPVVCYSIKCNSNVHILRLLRDAGASFDAVSGGEIFRAIAAGADSSKIVFAGVGKTRGELEYAVSQGIGWFNVESAAELDLLADVAQAMSRTVHAALRINPDVDAATHPYTTTGKRENKFGIAIEEAQRLFEQFADHNRVSIHGVHVHIGSPVRTTAPFAQAIERVLAFVEQVRSRGAMIDTINLGGGLPISDGSQLVPALGEYADAIVPLLRGRGYAIHMEPGRVISGNSGVLIGRVIYVKQGRDHRFVITDAAMTELIRPALYQAYHFIWPVNPGDGSAPRDWSPTQRPGTEQVDVVGPACESADFLGKDRFLPPVKNGDLLAVFSAGAYASSMSSQYNSRCRAAEVLVDGSQHRVIRRRESYDDLIRCEREAD